MPSSATKLKLAILALVCIVISLPNINFKLNAADINLAQQLSGRILLQVEDYGEAWYINPANQQRYYLGRPDDALNIMRTLGIGITNADLVKIPLALDNLSGADEDQDGLPDNLEKALGTDPEIIDSDNDGFDDKTELESGYSPINGGGAKLALNQQFARQHQGKIFLQVENEGEAWYINPLNFQRYYLGRPLDAFNLMKNLGLGATNQNLQKIAIGAINSGPSQTSPPSSPSAPACENCTSGSSSSSEQTFSAAANAIRQGNLASAVSYFTPEMQTAVEYTLNSLDSEGRLALGNILSDASLTYSSSSREIYSTNISFSSYSKTLNFELKKQPDGRWLLQNL